MDKSDFIARLVAHSSFRALQGSELRVLLTLLHMADSTGSVLMDAAKVNALSGVPIGSIYRAVAALSKKQLLEKIKASDGRSPSMYRFTY